MDLYYKKKAKKANIYEGKPQKNQAKTNSPNRITNQQLEQNYRILNQVRKKKKRAKVRFKAHLSWQRAEKQAQKGDVRTCQG